jgi:hypothetical protein
MRTILVKNIVERWFARRTLLVTAYPVVNIINFLWQLSAQVKAPKYIKPMY